MALKQRQAPSAAASTVVKRPASKRPSCRGLTSARCLSIIKKLDALAVVPKGEVQTLKRQAMKAARSRRQAEQGNAPSLLGRVISAVATALDNDVRQAQAAEDEAKNQHHARLAEQGEAELRFKVSKQAVLDGKLQLREAERAVIRENKAIAAVKVEKKTVAEEVKVMDVEKKHLQQVAETIYKPLKEASMDRNAAQKHVRQLCKAGQKLGFHKELLMVMPPVLRKELERRQTFDKTVVRSLDNEFAKHAQSLQSKLQENELALHQQDEALHEKQSALAEAKAACKATARGLADAKSAVEKGKKAIALAKRSVRKLPAAVKQATRKLEQAQKLNDKFRKGPLATYLKFRPAKYVTESDTEPEDDDEEHNEEEENDGSEE